MKMKSIKTIAGTLLIGGTIITSSLTAFGQSTLQVNAVTTNVNCFGVNDGTASLNISGGFPPYTYAWDFGATTQNLTDLPSGVYSVMVTDNSGASVVQTVTIDGPTAPLTITATKTNVTGFGQQDGTIDITVEGGSQFKWSINPYEVSWSNGASSWDQANLVAGVYTVNAEDMNGCTASKTVFITTPFPFTVQPADVFQTPELDDTEVGVVYPNPSSGDVSVILKDKSIDKVSIVSVITGEEIKSLNTLSSNINVDALNPGSYIVRYYKNGELTGSQRLDIVK